MALAMLGAFARAAGADALTVTNRGRVVVDTEPDIDIEELLSVARSLREQNEDGRPRTVLEAGTLRTGNVAISLEFRQNSSNIKKCEQRLNGQFKSHSARKVQIPATVSGSWIG